MEEIAVMCFRGTDEEKTKERPCFFSALFPLVCVGLAL